MSTPEILEKRKKTIKVLSNVSTLPSIPEVMFEVTRLLDDPATSTTTLSRIIGKDQGLVTKILSIANSALYGLARRVATIDYAILILGYQEIKNMVIALSMMEAFKNKNDVSLNYRDLWLHSILTGAAARRLALDLNYEKTGEAFVAGLLHDLGISVLHKYFHSTFLAIIDEVKDGGITFLKSEYTQLGLTHQDIAKFLAEKWNFPIELSEAIGFHHFPGHVKGDKKLAGIVHLADLLVNRHVNANFFWDKNINIDPFLFEVFPFNDESELMVFLDKYKNLLEEELKMVWF